MKSLDPYSIGMTLEQSYFLIFFNQCSILYLITCSIFLTIYNNIVSFFANAYLF